MKCYKGEQGRGGGADERAGRRGQAYLHEVHLRLAGPGDQGARPQRQTSRVSGRSTPFLFLCTLQCNHRKSINTHFVSIESFKNNSIIIARSFILVGRLPSTIDRGITFEQPVCYVTDFSTLHKLRILLCEGAATEWRLRVPRPHLQPAAG